MIHLVLILLSSLLQQGPGYTHAVGKAVTYHPGDGFCGKVRADGKPFLLTDDHFAHRTIPLGTTGYLCSIRTGLCTKSSCRDRGPFGATISCAAVKNDPSRLKEQTRVGLKPRLVHWGKRQDGSWHVCYWWQPQIRLRKGWKRRGSFDLTRPVAKRIGHKPFDKIVFFYKKTRQRSEI